MEPIAKFYREGQRLSIAKLCLAIILFFFGLAGIAELYVGIPNTIASTAPKEINPCMLRFVVHFVTAITFGFLGFFAKVALDFLRIGRKYPRHFIYCHQLPNSTDKSALVFGHFSIQWKRDINFCASGASYNWNGQVLTVRNHWTSMAIAPNTATSVLNEMFFVVNVQPPNTQIFERWFASYQRIKTKGIVTGDSAYQAVVQKLSGEVERPLLGYAELIAKRRWWGGVCAHNDDSLKAKTEEFVHKMMAKYIELYP